MFRRLTSNEALTGRLPKGFVMLVRCEAPKRSKSQRRMSSKPAVQGMVVSSETQVMRIIVRLPMSTARALHCLRLLS